MGRNCLLVTLLLTFGLVGRAVRAAEPAGGASAAAPAETTPASSSSPSSSPSNEIGGDPNAATAGVPMVDAAVQAATPARYGVGARMRLTSVPKWMLGLFLDESVPLTSYTAGLEFFRRSGMFEMVLGVAYQPLSPSPGNWLGKGNPPSVDTDYIQFDGLSALSVDFAFILHTEFNEYVGMHYGGGIGIAKTFGKMFRTSAGSAGCATAPGNTEECYPCRLEPNGTCTRLTPGQIANSGGGVDSNTSPSRFSEERVPTVYPIVNLITGLDVRLPNLPGFGLKLDVGYFFPYFFVGLGAAYQI